MADPTYSERVNCTSCDGSGSAGEHSCTDCLGKGLDQMAFAGGVEQALNDAYAEGRKDEREECSKVLKRLVAALDGASVNFMHDYDKRRGLELLAAMSEATEMCDDCAGTGVYSDGLPCDTCKAGMKEPE